MTVRTFILQNPPEFNVDAVILRSVLSEMSVTIMMKETERRQNE